MGSYQDWVRVSSTRRCPVCGKPDWCLVAGDGSAAICARVAAGAVKECGDAGWLHRLIPSFCRRSGVRAVTLKDRSPSRTDLPLLASVWARDLHPDQLAEFAAAMSVSPESLLRLRLGRMNDGWAWTFPMMDLAGNVVGIRLRLQDGSKSSMNGGREGIFLPRGLSHHPLVIAEGPTDTAALLDLGFNAVGRPSCMGGTQYLVELVQRRRFPQVAIVADNDEPGLLGADSLAQKLAPYALTVRVIVPPPPYKDIRDWKRAGASGTDVGRAIHAAPAYRLSLEAANGENHE